MSRDVFISYRSEDKQWAERICAALEQESLSCWMAPRDIPAAKEWATAIVENLQKCRAFVLVLSSNSKNARQIAREAELADKTGLPIITLRVEDVQPPPELLYFIGNVQWLDAFGDQFEPAMSRLIQVVRSAGQGDSPAPPRMPAAAPAAPPVATPAQAPPLAGGGMGKWIGIAAAAVVVIGAIIWFTMSHSGGGSGKGTDTSTTQQAVNPVNTKTDTAIAANAQDAANAKSIADQFMGLIKDGDLRGAWKLTSPAFQNTQPHFQKALRTELERDGGATQVQPDGPCIYDGSATYRCFYTLATKAKEKHATITITHTTGWLVNHWVLTG